MQESLEKIDHTKEHTAEKSKNTIIILITIAALVIASFIIFDKNNSSERSSTRFIDDSYVTTIEITSFSEGFMHTRELEQDDLSNISRLLSNIDERYKIVQEYQINSGVTFEDNKPAFIKSFSDNIYDNHEEDGTKILTKRDINPDYFGLNISIMRETKNGYNPTGEIIQMAYNNASTLTESSFLYDYIQPNEIVVPKDVYKDITRILLYKEVDPEIAKLYINLENTEHEDEISKVLSSAGYNIVNKN